ncbi:MAG: right-handed parallel beta-helix repeat-containing protein [Nanoarchaeota archaeon]|nr:right-handed parallel beta-helix repeat-containing protein [Nanoarchaeota archaeon]
MRKSLIFGSMILFMLAFASAATYNSTNNVIYECGDIVEVGTYEINQTIEATAQCLNILANDVEIVGNNNFIFTIDSGVLFGINIDSVNNITIKNIILTGFGISSINIKDAKDILLINNQIMNNPMYGLYADNVTNLQIINSTIEGDIEDVLILNRKWYLDISSIPTDINLTDGLKEGRNILDEGNYTITASNVGYASETQNISLYSNGAINFTLVDNAAPVITLVAPIIGYSTTSNSVLFEFNISDDSPVSCELFLNNVSSYNLTLANTSNIISLTGLSVGNHEWYVDCVDSVGNSNISETSLFSITAPVVTTSSGSSGGSSCGTSWTCSEWSECSNELQTRTCSYPDNYCTPTRAKPDEEQSCVEEVIFLEDEEPETTDEGGATATGGFFSLITGAVIGGGAVGWGIAIVFILLIGGGFVAVRVRRNKRKFSKKSSKK